MVTSKEAQIRRLILQVKAKNRQYLEILETRAKMLKAFADAWVGRRKNGAN